MRSSTLRGKALSGVLLVGICGAFVPKTALADEPAATDDSESQLYRTTIKDGVAEYEARRFEEARSLFRRAHEISPNARTFRGMGMAAFELRDYISAMRNLSAALRDSRKPLSEEQRKQAQELLDRSSLFIDVYHVKVTPRHARVIVDGHAPEIEQDGSLLFAFGRHTLEISAPDMDPQSIVVDVRGGEKKNYTIVLKPSLPEPQVEKVESAQAKPAIAVQEAAPPRAGGPSTLLFGISIGTALLAGGAGLSWWRENVELNSCRHPSEGQRCRNESTIKMWRDVAMGTTIASGAAALSFALWGFLSSSDSAAAPSATVEPTLVRCVPGPMALTCVGRF